MKLNVNAICDCGTVRYNNEDMVSIGGIMLRDDKLSIPVVFDDDGTFYLFVSDGMGGHEKGEVASSMLLEHLRDCFTMGDISAGEFTGDITRSVRYVSRKLNSLSQSEGLVKGMGCTLTGVVWIGGRLWLVNAGDSRTYLYHDGLIEQLTVDDENDGGLLTNCVGAYCDTTLNVQDITGKVQDDDILLVCSDGLGDVANTDYLEYFLMNSETPAEDLLEWAGNEGSSDNISVIVARIGGMEFGSPDECPDDDGRFDAWA